MHYTPLNYNQINVQAGFYSPSMVKSVNNKTFEFWERSLFQRACSVLNIEVPNNWKGNVRDFLYYSLFRYGYVAIADIEEMGQICFQPCNLKGYDFYYQPTNAIITNPALKESLDLKIGEECELLKLTPDYRGIWDIISYYAEKLSVLDNAINTSLINNKFAFFMGARNKACGEALKKMLDKINKGEPAIVYDMKLLNDPTDKAEPWQFWERSNLKSSYLTTDQLKDFSTLLNNFDAEIGIPTIPYEKKERMVESESESRIIDSTSRSKIWFDTMSSSIEKIKELYPTLKLNVSLRYDTGKEYAADGKF